ncbi:MAG: PKD domain containing protein [Candidatus Peregrinibacteria bacterium GW2011_GWA2_43_8]|nr:MAG: PKD domain containing protein [Candidatus Peregrinibacteria bacterium GW2011_GWA2_43_8]
MKFTEAEGATGITISLEGTKDGNGDDTVYHKLDCGNGTETYESENIITEICTYPEEGSYELSVEVTDVIGNIDRYIGDVVIASPAARIQPLIYLGTIATEFTFDGSASNTDKGTIANYDWMILGPDGTETVLGNEEMATYKPETPGRYTVSLEVTDSSDNSDTDTTIITVESQAPVPRFSYEIKDPAQPGTVYFDAGDSYDPDPDDIISYLWTFEGTEGAEYTFVEGDATSEKPAVKFKEAGKQNISLEVSDQYEDEDIRKTSTLDDKIEIESVLDVLLEMPDGIAYTMDSETGEVEVDFNAVSENAVAFEMDYGDSETEMTESIASGTATFTHTYKESGTYDLTLTAYDEDDNENTYTKKLYIGDSNSTIAVIGLQKDDIAVSMSDIQGSIKTVFTFDASESKNKDGSSRNLGYGWDFGDNTRSTEKKASHKFEEVGTYEITLTVSDEDDPTVTSEDTIQIVITEDPPEINSLTYTINSDSNVTPVEITLEVDAEDPDGSIANYYWYYYDTSDTTEKLGAQITKTNKAEMTISTNGTTGEEKEYAFVVEVTDTANNTVSSVDFLDEDPTMEVENGENASPIAEFSASDTQVMLGDSITLSSTSYDPDGDDLTYVWDLEGNGFSDNEESEETTLNFIPTAIGCYDIRLKVIDSGNQAATSDKTTEICVESIAEPPEAAFTYKVDNFDVAFTNNSTVDTANGAEFYAFYWDFDLATDSDGNGDKTDDTDSEEESPTYIYEETGTYEVKLTVYDNSGNSDNVTQSILISDTDPPIAAFTYEADGLSVIFSDNSETSSNDIEIVSYAWDFDSLKDSDGDSDKTNDTDSTSATPTHEYDDYGTYTIKLTVMDSVNKEDYVTRTVEILNEEELIGYLNTIPTASQSDGKVHLDGTSGKITLQYSTNQEDDAGIICWIDKNAYYDSDGDGKTNNDRNYEFESCTSGTIPDVNFESSWGPIVVILAVEDAQGNEYQVTKEVVFDIETGGTSMIPVSSTGALVLILAACSFALLGASIYTVKKIN